MQHTTRHPPSFKGLRFNAEVGLLTADQTQAHTEPGASSGSKPGSGPDPAGGSCSASHGSCERYESAIIRRLFQLNHMMMRVGDRMAAPHGLTGSRWMLLCALGRDDEPKTIAAISEELLLSPQNVSRMIVSMEEDGQVRRFNQPGAGRSTFVTLTEAGWEAYGVTRGLAERFCEPFLEGFTDDRADRLAEDLSRLLDNTSGLEARLLREAAERDAAASDDTPNTTTGNTTDSRSNA